jgi:protein-tyrosine kinase
MSLVELTLKKMQAARGGAVTRPPDLPARLGTVARNEPPAPGANPSAGATTKHHSDKLIRIDRQALRSAGLLPPDHQERQLSDQYRQIKRPLIAAASGRGVDKIANGQIIMMASAMPGEGKTFTSINLALSMSLEKDISVLLIDADVAKPHISRTFGVENEPGLLDVLHDDKLDIESLIIPTDVPNLSILPAGKASETATELLASNRMKEMVAQLARNDASRVALIDSSPLLLTSESHALSRAVGQVVLVVRAGQTPQQAVLNALDQIADGVSVGIILNQSTAAPLGQYYGYGYGDAQNPEGE